MTTVDVMQKVQLVDNVFTPSEARDIVNALIKEKINFHKVHRLCMYEGNANSDTSYDDNRVAQLLREKEEFKSVYTEAKSSNKKIKITGVLNIEILD